MFMMSRDDATLADSAYYLPDGEATLLQIPVHPIGFDDAKTFLQ